MFLRIHQIATALIAASCFLAPAAVASVFDNVYTRYMEEERFQYVSEFFTGREAADNRVLLRTKPDEREGLYVIVENHRRLRDLPSGSRLVLEMIRSDANEIETFEFSLPQNPARSRVIYLGLTGDDWPSPSVAPLAWRLRLLNSAGATLDTWDSFLWEMP